MPLELLEHQVPTVHQARLELPASPDHQDHPEQLVLLAHQALQVLLGLRAHQVQLVLLAQLVQQALKVQQDQLALQDLQGLQDPLDQQHHLQQLRSCI